MEKIKTVSLVIIALVLLANFLLTFVRPEFYLRSNSEELIEAYIQCHLARESLLFSSKDQSLIPKTNEKLRDAALVELQVCLDSSFQEQTLLALGVNPAELKRLELKALSDPRISLKYVTILISSDGESGEK